jgi:glutamine amidotransferase
VNVAAPAPQPLVIDLGVGNLGNLCRALRHLGSRPQVSSDPAAIAASRQLLLPGVGAFRPPRLALAGALEDALSQALAAGAWLLGICVGYQLLFSASEELGETAGLDLLPGRVCRLPQGVPVPHIGWNRLRQLADHPLVDGIAEGAAVYFVHGFAPQAVPDELWLASTLHGRRFAAAAACRRVAGVQFHPELSGATGLRVLRNFLDLSGAEEEG